MQFLLLLWHAKSANGLLTSNSVSFNFQNLYLPVSFRARSFPCQRTGPTPSAGWPTLPRLWAFSLGSAKWSLWGRKRTAAWGRSDRTPNATRTVSSLRANTNGLKHRSCCCCCCCRRGSTVDYLLRHHSWRHRQQWRHRKLACTCQSRSAAPEKTFGFRCCWKVRPSWSWTPSRWSRGRFARTCRDLRLGADPTSSRPTSAPPTTEGSTEGERQTWNG